MTEGQAEEILTSLSGQTHETVTGVSILSRKHKIRILFTDVSTVTFKPYGLETIRDYMQKVHVLDKAGAMPFRNTAICLCNL